MATALGGAATELGKGLVAFRITDTDAPTVIVVANDFTSGVEAWRLWLQNGPMGLTGEEASTCQPESVERLCDPDDVVLPPQLTKVQELRELVGFAEELRALLPDDLSTVFDEEDAGRASELCGFIAVGSGRLS
jgi:hypothetical protein